MRPNQGSGRYNQWKPKSTLSNLKSEWLQGLGLSLTKSINKTTARMLLDVQVSSCFLHLALSLVSTCCSVHKMGKSYGCRSQLRGLWEGYPDARQRGPGSVYVPIALHAFLTTYEMLACLVVACPRPSTTLSTWGVDFILASSMSSTCILCAKYWMYIKYICRWMNGADDNQALWQHLPKLRIRLCKAESLNISPIPLLFIVYNWIFSPIELEAVSKGK